MTRLRTRRSFLYQSAATGALLGLGDLGFLNNLQPVTAAEAKLAPQIVQLDPSIEPVVKLIEETPRERLLEEVAFQIQKGLSYQQVLAGLLSLDCISEVIA